MKAIVLAAACALVVVAADVDAARVVALVLLGLLDIVVIGWALGAGGRR